MKKIELITLAGVIFVAGMFTMAKIVVATLFTTEGNKYTQITDQIQILQTENTILKEQILNDSSYVTIAAKATALGFDYTKANQRLVLSDPSTVAFKP